MLLPLIVEGLFELVPQVIGWAVLKAVTFGRYGGFRSNTLLLEGAVGVAAVATACVVTSWLW
jgi:hypothetical protein